MLQQFFGGFWQTLASLRRKRTQRRKCEWAVNSQQIPPNSNYGWLPLSGRMEIMPEDSKYTFCFHVTTI
jgi:hypothetical protein